MLSSSLLSNLASPFDNFCLLQSPALPPSSDNGSRDSSRPPPQTPPAEAVSKIVTRANSKKEASEPDSLSPLTGPVGVGGISRPSSMVGPFGASFHGPSQQPSAVPWLEELTAKRQSITSKQVQQTAAKKSPADSEIKIGGYLLNSRVRG